MIFKFSVDLDRDIILVSWEEKSPSNEKAFHDIGGVFEDFNTYRLPLMATKIKQAVSTARALGKVTYTPEAKETFQVTLDRAKTLASLGDRTSSSEVPPLLAKEYPKTAKALRDYQRVAVQFLAANEYNLLADSPGAGKAQPISEPVLTPSGWKLMGEIKKGDYVIGSSGKPVEVLEVFPQGEREVVEVEFSDGLVVRCDWDHLWTVQKKHHRESGSQGWTKTARELLELGLRETSEKRRAFSIPRSPVVEFSKKDFWIDPYSWGAIVGDGATSTLSTSITTDREVAESLYLPSGVSLVKASDLNDYCSTYRLNGLSRLMKENGQPHLRAEEKSVPREILHGASEDRISFLQGLLDSDGTPQRDHRNGNPKSTIEYGTVSETLAYQVQELVWSLGGKASISEKHPTYTHNSERRKGQKFFRMEISLPEGVKPFRLKRKLDKWVPVSKYPPTRYITDIRGTEEREEMQCILIDSEDHLYLTKGYALTHNTLSTIASVVASGITGDILVLSPSIATQVVWPAEIKKWAPDDEVIVVTGTRKKREEQLSKLRFFSGKTRRRWILCNLEMAKVKYHKPVAVDGKSTKGRYEYIFPELFFLDYWSKQKNPREWSAIVVDESHRALVTKKTRPHEQTQIRCGFGKLSVKPGGKKIAISGTPFRGKLENLWGTLNWLAPKKYPAYWQWVSEWFYTEDKVINQFGETATSVVDLDPSKVTAFYESMAPFTLRRTKAEIAKELPPKTYAGTIPDDLEGEYTEEERRGLIGHWLDMEPKQKKAYAEMQEDAIAYLDSGSVVANGQLAVMTRLKQFAGCYGTIETKEDSDGFEIDAFKPALPSNKFTWLLEFLSELGIDKEGDSGPEARKVVVASQFTSVINVFQAALEKRGIKTLKISGGVSAGERKKAAELFQTDHGPQVFLLNTNAGGVALTLDRADDIVILDETFIPDDQEQVEDRVHRVSRNHNVTIHYLRSKGTIEESIARTTFGRDQIQKQVLDGERGINFAKQILLTKA